MLTNQSKPPKRKAFPCKRCFGEMHWKNKIGGIQCFACSPPKRTTDVVARLRIEDGQWVDDSTPRFDLVDVPNAEISACQTAAITPRQTDQGPKASQQTTKEGSGLPREQFVVGYFQRGVHGELSEYEVDLFTSEKLWETKAGEAVDQWLVIKPRMRSIKNK